VADGIALIIPGISQGEADGRYVKRYVGATLAADTAEINGQPTLYNPNGPVMGLLPDDAAPVLLVSGTGGRFGTSVEVVRAGGGFSSATMRGTTVGGSLQSPAANASGDRLFTVTGAGYDGAQSRSTGQIFFRTIEAWTPTALGTEIVFAPVALGTQGVFSALRMRSDAAGVLDLILDRGTTRFRPATRAQLRNPSDTATHLEWDATGLSVYGVPTVARQTVTGSRASGAALVDLLLKLQTFGVIIDGTTA
jgi:hypothetical protein